MMDMKETMEQNGDQFEGMIQIRRKDFLLVHDYFAMVLNLANEAHEASEAIKNPLSMEECAGRILVVTMMQMESLKEKDPELIEELMVAATMAENTGKRHIDTMYG